jgi:hypothetical protein
MMNVSFRANRRHLGCAIALLMTAGVASHATAEPVHAAAIKPVGLSAPVLATDAVDLMMFPSLDMKQIEAEDVVRAEQGLPPRYAVPHPVLITPDADGTWEVLDESTDLWRLVVTSPGAVSINLGFDRYNMPEGGRLQVYAADGTTIVRPFTAADNETHGELWTPPVPGDKLVVEVVIPAAARDALELELTSVNLGYRGFSKFDGGDKSGSCNVDVVCPEGDDWRDEIASVGVISTGGSTFCTGFMVNNTAEDGDPLFMTADHCGIGPGNAASLVVFWNYETSVCGGTPDGVLSDFQTGSFHLRSYGGSDVTLVRLDDMPNPEWEVSYAGWDNSGAEATTAIAIHHPSTDEKRISFEFQPTTTTSYLGNSSPGDGTHVRVDDWDIGTTEPGSSGSPLFNQDHRVIGQLHGGYAACGNDDPDWYGKMSVSWANGLAQYLDPLGTGATAIDTYVPWATGLRVLGGNFEAEGPKGGPFTPDAVVYTLRNQSDAPISYTVNETVSWLEVTNGAGTIPVDGETLVTVALTSAANSLPKGDYTDTISFINNSTHDGDATRPAIIRVGVPVPIYSYPMDNNPGWTLEGDWAFGQPSGNGGQYGFADPIGGYTGSNVLGYNLNGDYPNNLAQRHLTTTPIDCSNLSQVQLKFRRWLGVERPAYDHAYIRVSNDGSNWTTVWENGEEITDNSWKLVEYDISSVADGSATVYVRWTMGTTDGSWQYCGWNIDDVEIWGVEADEDLPGDLNGDGCVDLTDLGILLASYEVDDGGDIDGDGDTDLADLGALLANYGVGCG